MLEYAYLPPLEKDGIMFFKRVGNEDDIAWLKKLGFEVHEDAFVTWRGKFIHWNTVYDLYIDTDPPSESNLKEFCDDIMKKIKTHVDNTFAIDYTSETTINFKSIPSPKCIQYIDEYFSKLRFSGTFSRYSDDDYNIIKDDAINLGIAYPLKKEEDRYQLKLTWKYGEVFYFDEEEEEPMKDTLSASKTDTFKIPEAPRINVPISNEEIKDIKNLCEENIKKTLTAMDAAGLADNKNDWNEAIEYSINRECTRLRDENKIDELIKHILESIKTYANEGKYELNVVFNDGKLFTDDIKDPLIKLGYDISIKKSSLKKANGVEVVYFVNVINWSKPKE
jgi:hypothetical protein